MHKRFHFAIAEGKYVRPWNFSTKCPPSKSSIWGEDFKNRLNTFRDIGFLLAECTGWKWENFKYCRCAKFSPCHCERKIPAHLKLSTQMAIVNIFELWERFPQSIEYLWRYRIFARTVYRLNVAKFQRLSMRQSIHLAIAKVKYLRTWNFPPKWPTLNIFELKRRFRQLVEYLWRYRISACTVYMLKVGKIWNVVDAPGFHLAIAKGKYLRHLKLNTQMPTLNIFELGQKFQKSVEYLWRYRILAGTVYRLNSGKISNVVDSQSFQFAIAKVKGQRTWNFPPKWPPSTSSRWRQRFRQSAECLWRYRISACTVYRLNVPKFEMLSMRQVFT